MDTKTCMLRTAADAGIEECPGEPCGFWERGCLVERLGIPLEPSVARHLLDLRLALEAGRRDEEREARARLHALLNASGK